MSISPCTTNKVAQNIHSPQPTLFNSRPTQIGLDYSLGLQVPPPHHYQRRPAALWPQWRRRRLSPNGRTIWRGSISASHTYQVRQQRHPPLSGYPSTQARAFRWQLAVLVYAAGGHQPTSAEGIRQGCWKGRLRHVREGYYWPHGLRHLCLQASRLHFFLPQIQVIIPFPIPIQTLFWYANFLPACVIVCFVVAS